MFSLSYSGASLTDSDSDFDDICPAFSFCPFFDMQIKPKCISSWPSANSSRLIEDLSPLTHLRRFV